MCMERTPRLQALRELFRPSSIALVGASDDSRWSLNTYMNLRAGGFTGRMVMVNPRRRVVHGEPAVPSLRSLDSPVDLAYVMVGPDHILDVVDDAAAAGVRQMVVLTAGFSETGDAGRALERALEERVRAAGITVLGPNGNGFVNAADGIMPYGLPLPLPLVRGGIGVVLQSGALASAVLALAQARMAGISLLVSMGNEGQVRATDVMDYLVADPATRVIACFLEGIRDADAFAEVAQRALQAGKPLVVLKTGRSAAGAKSALAHTGALVGDDAVHDAALQRLGVIRVRSLEDLITTAALLDAVGPPPGRRMAVVTASGGACDVIADRAADEGLELPPFTPATVERLRQELPAFATPQNPLDVTGYVLMDRTLQRRAAEIVAEDTACDFLAVVLEPPRALLPDAETVRASLAAWSALSRASAHPVLLMSNAMTDIPEPARALVAELGLHFAGGMEHALTALGHAVRWRERREQWLRAHAEGGRPWRPALVRTLARGRSGDDAVPRPDDWSEWRARAYLAERGIPLVPGRLARTPEDAAQAAEEFCGPLVLKIQSPDLPHKSDVGGVVLGVQGPDAARAAWQDMWTRIRQMHPHVRLEGVLVSPQRAGGVELMVGMMPDPVWGWVLAVGTGGIFVEVLRDTRLAVWPVTEDEIVGMLRSLRGAPLLLGARGREPADLGRVAGVVRRLGEIAVEAGPGLAALEVNPLWVSGTQVEVLDALIRWRV